MKFPEITKLEIHFATFSKPLLLFDIQLKYKMVIDWNEKSIYPIDVGIAKIKLNEYRLPNLQ